MDAEVRRLLEEQERRIDALQKQLEEMRALVTGLQTSARTANRRPRRDAVAASISRHPS
jgi:hypothetical protein